MSFLLLQFIIPFLLYFPVCLLSGASLQNQRMSLSSRV